MGTPAEPRKGVSDPVSYKQSIPSQETPRWRENTEKGKHFRQLCLNGGRRSFVKSGQVSLRENCEKQPIFSRADYKHTVIAQLPKETALVLGSNSARSLGVVNSRRGKPWRETTGIPSCVQFENGFRKVLIAKYIEFFFSFFRSTTDQGFRPP